MNDEFNQQIAQAQKAFTDFHQFKSTSGQRELTQALLGLLQALLTRFWQVSPEIGKQPSKPDTDAEATEVRSVVDAYLLRLKQDIRRLEKQTGETGLMEVHEMLHHAFHNQVEVLRMEARTNF